MDTSSAPFPLNPNPTFIPHTPSNTHNHNFLPPSPSPPIPDLSTTLSSLKSLISLSNETLNSISKTLTINSQNENNLVPCIFNPHHLMPPESLFLHSLRCPSPLDLTSLLDCLNYPNTIKSSSELQHEARLMQHPKDPGLSELCFSLDDFVDFGSNFFYKDCPGVVNYSDIDSVSKVFTLPGVLFVECANFVGFTEREVEVENIGIHKFHVLPSDLCVIRNETDSWGDYPVMYSFNMLCAILGSKMVRNSDLRKWLISNSPRYGIVIDVYMRDHIYTLFKLCLKAIVSEAFALFESVVGQTKVSLKSKTFESPVLVKVLSWLVSQLSVLYGEVNAKFFVIHMLKQCLLESAAQFLLFPLEEKVSQSSKLTECCKDVKPETEKKFKVVCDDSSLVFVSQVAAAVAALQERSLLEGKIRGLRFRQPPLTKYQRTAEHDFISKRADEERRIRPSYKPIIDHDGLPRQSQVNQDTGAMKTREQLLAEERDYKRRRMSYRGKKVKRTPLQVLRDIIDEYTEEIRQAGGIGCFERGAAEGRMLQSIPSDTYDGTRDSDVLMKSKDVSSEALEQHKNEMHYDRSPSSSKFKDDMPRSYKQSRQEHHRSRNVDREKREKSYDSGSRRRHHGRPYEKNDHRMDMDDTDFSRNHNSDRRSSSRGNRSYSQDIRSRYSVKNSSDDRRQKDRYKDDSSRPGIHDKISDRYDPSESKEDYVFKDDRYGRPE